MPSKPPLHGIACLPRAPAQRYDDARGSAASRGYDRTWRKVRLQKLADEPLCRFCFALGLIVAATVVDHIETVRARPDLRLDPSNLRPLCESCHNAHTARQGGGGQQS